MQDHGVGFAPLLRSRLGSPSPALGQTSCPSASGRELSVVLRPHTDCFQREAICDTSQGCPCFVEPLPDRRVLQQPAQILMVFIYTASGQEMLITAILCPGGKRGTSVFPPLLPAGSHNRRRSSCIPWLGGGERGQCEAHGSSAGGRIGSRLGKSLPLQITHWPVGVFPTPGYTQISTFRSCNR